jgi:hypothetical protein
MFTLFKNAEILFSSSKVDKKKKVVEKSKVKKDLLIFLIY